MPLKLFLILTLSFFILVILSFLVMDKKSKGSPEESSSEQQRLRGRPQTASAGGSEVVGVGGSSSSFDTPAEQEGGTMARPSTPPGPHAGGAAVEGYGTGGKGGNVQPKTERLVANVGSGSSQGKKRGRSDESAASSGGPSKSKKKGELNDPPKGEPQCATCGKSFGSWKSLFGHLRSHPDRDYRGAFPPPKAAPSQQGQSGPSTSGNVVIDPQQQHQLASSLLGAAKVVQSRMSAQDDLVEGEKDKKSAEHRATATEAEASSSNMGVGFDLNQPNQRLIPLRKDGLNFDLNMPAPPDSDEEDEEDATD